MWRSELALLSFLIHLLTFSTNIPNVRCEETRQFLWLTDIHLDPYYGTEAAAGLFGSGCDKSSVIEEYPHGKQGCDAPYSLVMDAMQQVMEELDGNVDFAVVTGDFCRHANDKLDDPIVDTERILSNVSQIFKSTLVSSSGTPLSIVPSLGNNDITPDYFLDLDNPSALLDMATSGFGPLFESDYERSTFAKGGYLVRNVTDRITVISLNTIVYSVSHNPDQSQVLDPFGQFTWLDEQLRLAWEQQRFVYIIGHVPPAMGSFRHSQLWHDHYLRRYYTILADYTYNATNSEVPSPVVAGQFFGHLHSDEIRLIPAGLDTNPGTISWPLLLSASLTPIYGGNPSFRLATYNTNSGFLLNYDTYYVDLKQGSTNDQTSTWKKEQSFQESFGVKDLSPTSLQQMIVEMNESIAVNNSSKWQALQSRLHVQVDDGSQLCLDSACRKDWICTMTTTTTEEFNTCQINGGLSSTMRIVAIIKWPLGLIGLVCGTMFIVVHIQRYLRRRQYQQQVDVEVGELEDKLSLEERNSGMVTFEKEKGRLPDIS